MRVTLKLFASLADRLPADVRRGHAVDRSCKARKRVSYARAVLPGAAQRVRNVRMACTP